MKNITLLKFFLIAGIFFSCSKEPGVVQSDSKDILDFKIEAALNSGSVKKDITATISQDTILLLIEKSVDISNLIATFTTSGQEVFVGNTVQQSGITPNDFSKELKYLVKAENGSEKKYIVSVKEKIPDWKAGIPHIFIETENKTPVTSKDDYLNATLKIQGIGDYENYEGSTRIKGRGNSTWLLAKKPYRLKLDKAASLLGLPAEKDWILLANYLDPTLMLNAVAMKAGHLLEMPYTNHIIPVDVTINGTYMGSYNFTEHKEVGPDRIDLKDGGVLLELDIFYDEAYKFKSTVYNLPVMVQFPELEDYPHPEAAAELAKIKAEFNTMEQAVSSLSFPNNNYLDYIDAAAMVDYLIVYNLCQNEEINHPKSTYMHKHAGGKYKMGIIWDFDWAFDYEDDNVHFNKSTNSLFWSRADSTIGTRFFSRFMKDPTIQTLYKKEWNSFKANKFPELLQYLDDYAVLIRESQKKDYALWKKGSGDFTGDVQKLRTWLQQRAAYMDNYVAGF